MHSWKDSGLFYLYLFFFNSVILYDSFIFCNSLSFFLPEEHIEEPGFCDAFELFPAESRFAAHTCFDFPVWKIFADQCFTEKTSGYKLMFYQLMFYMTDLKLTLLLW